MGELLPRVKFYQEKADALLRLALETRDDCIKRKLMGLALQFEHLAEEVRVFDD